MRRYDGVPQTRAAGPRRETRTTIAYAVGTIGVFRGIYALAQWLKFLAAGEGAEDALSWWTAGRILRLGQGSRLFDLGLQSDVQRAAFGPGAKGGSVAYVLAPHLSFLLYPLGFLRPRSAYVAVSALQLAALVLVLVYLWRNVAVRWTGAERYLAVGAAVGASPAILSVQLGSLSMLIAAAGIVGIVAARRGHATTAGVAVALTLLKPQLAIAVVATLVISRHWRAVWTAAVVSVAAVAVSFPLLGMGPYRAWPHLLSAVSEPRSRLEEGKPSVASRAPGELGSARG